jgi:hypothetical protein
MSKKAAFVVGLAVLLTGLFVGSLAVLATADVPASTARALATERYSRGTVVVESYSLPSEYRLTAPRIFLVCGMDDDLHKVKVGGTAMSPVVTDMGIINGVVCK